MDRRVVTALGAAGLLAVISAQAGASERAEKDVGINNDPGPNGAAETTIFWPKAFFANVTGEKASDLSHLKQRMISIEQASIDGQCAIQFAGPRPPGT